MEESVIIKHSTLELWGTKEGLEEYARVAKEVMEKWELRFWWPNKYCSYCDYTPCRCSKENYDKGTDRS